MVMGNSFAPFGYREGGYNEGIANSIYMVIVFVMILVAAVVGVTYYFLLSFANKMRVGIETENIDQVNGGLRALKVHYIIIGILLMLGILASLYNMTIN